jgi:uncharacterized protein
MSYSIDANVLLYASNTNCPEYEAARNFLQLLPGDPDLLCLTWPALMAYQRIATHPSIFANPLSPKHAWENIEQLLSLPRACLVQETEDFQATYRGISSELGIHGNLVPDAHIAAILRLHGVRKLYSTDSDFRKFPFLDVVNPLI